MSNCTSRISYRWIAPLLELPVRYVLSPRGTALAIFFLYLSLSVSTVAAAEVDPLEEFNRPTHAFNQFVDRLFVKPIATTYRNLTPRFVKRGVSNFFSNLDDVQVAANDILRLDLPAAATTFGRLAVNSTVGVGGLVEVASPVFGLRKTQQDFGLTLAHYGVSSGPYVVLPLLGPSTVRDAFGLGIDTLIDPLNSVDEIATRNGLRIAQVTSYRASVLTFDDLVIGDNYLFYREAYLQRREAAAGASALLGFSFGMEDEGATPIYDDGFEDGFSSDFGGLAIEGVESH